MLKRMSAFFEPAPLTSFIALKQAVKKILYSNDFLLKNGAIRYYVGDDVRVPNYEHVQTIKDLEKFLEDVKEEGLDYAFCTAYTYVPSAKEFDKVLNKCRNLVKRYHHDLAMFCCETEMTVKEMVLA